jgi:hypothetical protein
VLITDGGASVATGWNIFSEVMPMMTVLATEVTGAVEEMTVAGVEIEVLIKGPLVRAPDDPILVMTVPLVLGVPVLRLGRIWTVPELLDMVETDTLGVTVEVLTTWKKIPPVDVDDVEASVELPLGVVPAGALAPLLTRATEDELDAAISVELSLGVVVAGGLLLLFGGGGRGE